MESILITNKQFNSMLKLKSGVVHYNGDTIYKQARGKKDILEYLYIKKSNSYMTDCILPDKHIILDSKYGKIDFGYTEQYIKDMVELKQKELSFMDAKGIITKIIQLLQNLENDDMLYIDIHERNVLIKNNNIKLIDMDSIKIIPRDDYVYSSKLVQKRIIIELMLTIFLKSKNHIMLYKVINDVVKQKCFPKEFIEYCIGCYYDDPFVSNVYPLEYLDLFDSENIEYQKMLLKV